VQVESTIHHQERSSVQIAPLASISLMQRRQNAQMQGNLEVARIFVQVGHASILQRWVLRPRCWAHLSDVVRDGQVSACNQRLQFAVSVLTSL
jgi:hypothetical protein